MNKFNLSITARQDGTLEAAYIKLSEEKVSVTKEFGDSVLLDFDASENLVGVEILEPIPISLVHSVADSLKEYQRNQLNSFVEEYAPRALVTS